jgi:hypothetical protein
VAHALLRVARMLDHAGLRSASREGIRGALRLSAAVAGMTAATDGSPAPCEHVAQSAECDHGADATRPLLVR